ncbi:SagB family peptide dehydrogenase [Sorangium sp. So ce367]|uniref:SagB/ThcOx family dehydrogenase n=1 Tax=Sorangium sp. So ce367 TaxID=3133305 RepID=UPI003F642562
MATTIDLSLADGVELRISRDEELSLAGRFGELILRRPPDQLRVALEALASGPVTEMALLTLAGDHAPQLFYHLNSAANLCLLRTTVTHDGHQLMSSSATSPYFIRSRSTIGDGVAYEISRFAVSRVEDGRMVLESPLSHVLVVVHDRRVASLLFELARPISPRAAAERAPDLDIGATRAVLQLLVDAGLAAPAPAEAAVRTPTELALRQWEPHDLLFHARSRGTRHGRRWGATYRFAGEIPPLPSVKPPMGSAFIDLPRPDIEALRTNDVPFTEVLERRRSIRPPAAARLTLRQLGEFLFRSARIRQVRTSSYGENTDRPYPGAGSQYEIEVYPVVHVCDGVAAGMYHYCPLQHRLEAIAGATPDVRALLASASASKAIPDVLFVIAARFQRIAWKYESIAYSLILKDVGVVLQTMYLVATAMSLAPYAIGHGDPDLFCRAAGTDYYVESSVGEFALGGSTS